ncbi:MAG: mechanosensitive ion channel domain-containing protein, partial [Phycisphaerae bacterium]
PGRRQEMTGEVRTLLETRKSTVSRLIAQFENYYKPLLELADSKRALATEAEQLSQFIDERVFWIPSTTPIGLADVGGLWVGLRWLANPSTWASAARALVEDARENPFINATLILAIGLAAVLRRRAASAARQINARVMKDFPGSFMPTVWSLLLTFVLAAVWPAALAALGWRLTRQGGESPFAGAIGEGLIFLAMVWLPLGLLRRLCREKGVGETHFRWTSAVARQVRTSLVRPMFILLPLVFLVAAAEAHSLEAVRVGLGRVAAMAALVVLAVFLAGVLRPKGTIYQDISTQRKSSWVAKLWLLWYPVAVAAPAALAVAAAMGYYFTTVHLSVRLLGQLWWIIAVVIFNGLLLRMIFIARRKLAAREIKKRKQDLAEKEKKKEEEGEDAPEAIETEQPRVDLAAVNEQTRRFLRYVIFTLLLAGTWMIWDDVLPALNLLGRVPLWGAITAADVTMALVLLILTIVATRNVPGMLEISILQRIHAEPGVRYAINALTQYTLFVIGFVLAFNAIGVGWSQVQWLVAAMTVGLGFGLQEIFANFVSGLIILFERPIRVGDVVTIGGVTGTVTRIRIRATTVVDWDRKELILPNKDFITGQLINWTLSDSVIRVVVPVGIAYGSNTRLARDLLLEVAEMAERVLEDPAPQAFFMGFGDSCLDYELRVHVSGLQDFLRVKNDLHVLIDEEFRRHGIEIAFPQRDIHIRSVDGRIPLGVTQDPSGGGGDKPPADSPDVVDPPADPG